MASEKKKLKTGQFSAEEITFIGDNVYSMTPEEMAIHLNRSVESVAKRAEEIRDNKNLALQKVESKKAIEGLRSKPYWDDLKQQYTEKELELYQYHWAKYQEQFSYDVTHSEESQICKAIDLEILMARILKEKFLVDAQIQDLEKEVKREILLGDSMDKDHVTNTRTMINSIRSSQTSRTKEYQELLDRVQKIARDLKTTRDQRFKQIKDRKVTFEGWLLQFQDIKKRHELDKEAALISASTKKATKDLAEYHTFIDGSLDQPLLCSETIKEDHT